jgi:hypothetical protein
MAMMKLTVDNAALYTDLDETKKYFYIEGKRIVKIVTGVTTFRGSMDSILVEIGKDYAPNEYFWRLNLDSRIILETEEPIYASVTNEFIGVIKSIYDSKIKATGIKYISYLPADKTGGIIGTMQMRSTYGFHRPECMKKFVKALWNKAESKIYLYWAQFND